MSRRREEIKCKHLACHVSKLLEDHRIARERLRIAGNVNDALWRETRDVADELFVASRSRRVEDDNVGCDLLAAFGFCSILLAVGPLLDSCTIFTTASRITWKYVCAVFAAGFLVNLKHAIACAVTMLLLSKPLLQKLDRLKNKYGMMDVREETV